MIAVRRAASVASALPRPAILSFLAPETLVACCAALVLGAVAAGAAMSSPTLALVLIAAATFPFVAMVTGVKRPLIAIAILDTSLNWDVNFWYDDEAAARGAFGGLSFSLTTMALLGLYSIWLFELLARSRSTPQPRLRWALPAAAYVGLTVPSLLSAYDPRLALFEIAFLIQGLLLFVYIASFVRTARDVHFVVATLVVALTVQAGLIVATRYAGVSLDFAGLETTSGGEREVSRASGTLGSPNTAGSFLAAALLLPLSLLAARTLERRARLALPAAGLGAVALILTLSRGAWLAFAVSLVALLAFFAYRGLTSRRILALGAATVVVGVAFGGLVADRLSRDDAGAARSRIDLFNAGVDVIRDHAFFGVGANNFTVVLPSYAELVGYAYIPHNRFLLVWSEAGVAAALALAALIGIVLRRGWLAIRRCEAALVPYAVGTTVAFLALAIHMNFEPFNSRPQLQLFWLLAGLVTAIRCLTLQGRREVAVA